MLVLYLKTMIRSLSWERVGTFISHFSHSFRLLSNWTSPSVEVYESSGGNVMAKTSHQTHKYIRESLVGALPYQALCVYACLMNKKIYCKCWQDRLLRKLIHLPYSRHFGRNILNKNDFTRWQCACRRHNIPNVTCTSNKSLSSAVPKGVEQTYAIF